MSAFTLEVQVVERRQPRGNVGPCCHQDCAEPATSILILNVGGLGATVWVCEEHRPR